MRQHSAVFHTQVQRCRFSLYKVETALDYGCHYEEVGKGSYITGVNQVGLQSFYSVVFQ